MGSATGGTEHRSGDLGAMGCRHSDGDGQAARNIPASQRTWAGRRHAPSTAAAGLNRARSLLRRWPSAASTPRSATEPTSTPTAAATSSVALCCTAASTLFIAIMESTRGTPVACRTLRARVRQTAAAVALPLTARASRHALVTWNTAAVVCAAAAAWARARGRPGSTICRMRAICCSFFWDTNALTLFRPLFR